MARDTESSRADAIRVAGCETILTGTDPFNSVAVLGDDGIYLAQPGIQAVLALAPPSWATTVVGRVGAGPGEYVRPMEVFALSGGRVAVLDAQLRRIIVFRGSSYLESFPTPKGGDPFGIALDQEGHLFGAAPYFPAAAQAPAAGPDSVALLTWRDGDASPDTIGFLRAPLMEGLANRNGATYRQVRFSLRDVWGVGEGGGVWVARGSSNRVE